MVNLMYLVHISHTKQSVCSIQDDSISVVTGCVATRNLQMSLLREKEKGERTCRWKRGEERGRQKSTGK